MSDPLTVVSAQEVERTFEHEMPEVLSDKQIGGIVAAVGNHEGKALTFLLMHPGIAYDKDQLHDLFIGVQGNKVVYEGNRSIQFEYCDVFESVGLVAKGFIVGEGVVYEKTQLGNERADAVAGGLVQISEDFPEFSLVGILSVAHKGRLGNRETTAPETRLQIFRHLLHLLPDDGHITMKQLRQEMPEVDASSLSRHINNLKKEGVVEYKSRRGMETPHIYFIQKDILEEGVLNVRIKEGSLTHAIFNIIKARYSDGFRSLNADQIRKELEEKHPELDFTAAGFKQAFEVLGRNGCIVREEREKLPDSELKLSDRQRSLMSRIVELVDGVQAGDAATIEIGKMYAKDIIADPERVRALMTKAYERSNFANGIEDDRLASLVKLALSELEGPTDIATLGRLLGELGVTYTLSTIRDRLRELPDEEIVAYTFKSRTYVELRRNEDLVSAADI